MASNGWIVYLLPQFGVIVYLTLIHTVVWLGRRSDRLHLWVALWFATCSGFVLSRIVQIGTQRSLLVIDLVRLQYAAALLLGLLATRIGIELGASSLPAWARRLAPALTAVLIAGLWVIPDSNRVQYYQTSLGERFLGVRPGWYPLLTGAIAFTAMVGMVAALRGAQELARRERGILALSLVLASVLGAHDMLIFVFGVRWLPLIDFGFLGVGLAFTWLLLHRYIQLAGRLEALVERRTDELASRNRELAAALERADRAHRRSLVQAAALARSEASARALIEGSPDGIAVARDGRLLFSNARCAELLGRPGGWPAGVAIGELVAAEDRAGLEAAVAAAGRRAAPPAELRLRVASGPGEADRHIHCDLLAVTAEFDGAPATLVVLRDQSERRELQQRLLASDRLAALGTMAAGVAHEINNPLAFVLTNADVLLERVKAAEQGVALDTHDLIDIAGDIEMGAERVRRIVRDLQLLSRAPAGQRELVSPARTMETSLRLSRSELRHRAQVIEELGDTPLVLAEEAQLGQVFVNLLVNAAHAIVDGDSDHHQIRVSTRTGACGEAVIEVKDDGAGIAPEVLPRIFDPFFTTKRPGEGTGLGLSICHGIVSALGGTIEVESRLGEGTRARVTLPAAAERAAPPAVAAAVAAASATGRLRILVVDDEPQVARVFVRALPQHSVAIAGSASEASARLDAGEEFDLIFCDLMMPTVSGMEFFDQVAHRTPRYKDRFVFVTGGAFTERAREFLEHTAAPTLYKPFQAESIRRILEDARVARPAAPALRAITQL